LLTILSRFVAGLLAFIFSFIMPTASFTQMLYRQALFASTVLYGGTYFANTGFSLQAIKEIMQDVFGLYFIILLIFLTSPSNTIFVVLMTLWAFSQLPSLVQRYCQKHNISNSTLHNLITKGSLYAPRARDLAARMEFFLLISHIIGLFGSDRQILRTLMVFNFVMARYVQSPQLQQYIYSMKVAIDQLAHHPNCPTIISTAYDKLKQGLSTYIQSITQRQ